MALLTLELIQSAERPGLAIDTTEWSAATLGRLRLAKGTLHAGQDVGRHRDLSVIAVAENDGAQRRVLALLRMANMRLPDQQWQLDRLFTLPNFRGVTIDLTGLGIGLVEYAQLKWRHRVRGLNFACVESINPHLRRDGRPAETARVPENLATELLAQFEQRTLMLEVNVDAEMLEDLRKPERIVSPGGRVSRAATRTGAGHADHFWAIALAVRDDHTAAAPVAFSPM